MTLLATRAIDLLTALRHRGHAATDATQLLYQHDNSEANNEACDNFTDEELTNATENNSITPWQTHKLPSELKKARSKPQWSSLNSGKAELAQSLRMDATWSLASKLSNQN